MRCSSQRDRPDLVLTCLLQHRRTCWGHRLCLLHSSIPELLCLTFHLCQHTWWLHMPCLGPLQQLLREQSLFQVPLYHLLQLPQRHTLLHCSKIHFPLPLIALMLLLSYQLFLLVRNPPYILFYILHLLELLLSPASHYQVCYLCM